MSIENISADFGFRHPVRSGVAERPESCLHIRWAVKRPVAGSSPAIGRFFPASRESLKSLNRYIGKTIHESLITNYDQEMEATAFLFR